MSKAKKEEQETPSEIEVTETGIRIETKSTGEVQTDGFGTYNN